MDTARTQGTISKLNASPTFERNFKCEQCGMLFSSEESLQKHTEKFCIGVPDSGVNRDDISYDESSIQIDPNLTKQGNGTFYIETPRPKTDELSKHETNPESEKKAIEDLENWKNQKSIEQSVKDMEDLVIRDSIRDKQLVDTLKATDNLDEDLLQRKDNSSNDPYKSLMKEVNYLKNFNSRYKKK